MTDIKDRGTKKWTSIMIPEHVEMLRELDSEYYKQNKPILDEYQLQEIDERLRAAQEFKLPLVFELWIGGLFEEVEAVVKKVDQINKIVWVTDLSGDLHKLKYDSIVGVEFAD